MWKMGEGEPSLQNCHSKYFRPGAWVYGYATESVRRGFGRVLQPAHTHTHTHTYTNKHVKGQTKDPAISRSAPYRKAILTRDWAQTQQNRKLDNNKENNMLGEKSSVKGEKG